MTNNEPETIAGLAARLMRGHEVRLARLGILRSSHSPARREGATWFPPHVDVILDLKSNLGESEPPSPVDFLSRRIREELHSTQLSKVDGLGQFSVDGDEILFSADRRLTEVVNAPFSHLEAHDAPNTDNEPLPDILPVSAPALTPEPDPEPEPSATPTPPKERPLLSSRAGRRPRGVTSTQRDPKSIPTWAVIAMALVPVLGIALFVLIWTTDSPNAESTPAGSEISTAVEQPAAADSVAAPTEVPPEELPEALTEAPPEEPAAVDGRLSRGLPGYTLVVASGISRASAEALVPSFADLPFPTGVLAYETDGNTIYRLAVGQFATVAEADSVRQAMSERLPDGTWVRRLD